MWKMKSIILIVLLIASCDQGASSFTDRYTEDALLNRRHQMLTAPIIFVGVVEAVHFVGNPKPALSVQGLTLQLYRARCHVEMTLRGEVPKSFEFRYFGPDPRYGLQGFPKFWLQPTERRMFFLEQHGSTYRAVGDYVNYTENVYSGKPDSRILTTDPDVGKAIARVMLTPGPGFDERLFSSDLGSASQVAEESSSKSYSIELLKGLLTHPSALVRKSSCRILAMFYKERSAACSGE